MKLCTTVFLFTILLFVTNSMGQVITKETTLRTKDTQAIETSLSNCKQIDAKIINGILNKTLVKDLEVYLNRTNSFVTLLGQKNRISIPEKEVQAVRKWTYFVNDIRSIKSWSEYNTNTNSFFIYIEFEGNHSEIKGKCPGCAKPFRDSRAPDLNWEGKRVARVWIKPIPHNNSISFEVVKVDLMGKFDLNGPLDALIPPVIKYFEKQIKKEMERTLHQILNIQENKNAIAKAFTPTLQFIGLNTVTTIRLKKGQMQLCN